MDRYQVMEPLGEGAYGVVYRARDRLNGNAVVAMKRIRIPTGDGSEGIPATALREIAVLREIECENVVRLLNVVLTEARLYLVFEYMDVDLKNYMDSCGPEGMSPELVRSFAYQMLSGVAHCHAHRIVHRDLKPQNILLDRHGNLKLGDFGLARAFNVPIRQYTHEIVTLWYRAPEVLLSAPYYSTPVDLWAVACIVAEMSSLAALFPGDSEIDQLFRVFRVLGTPTDATWPGIRACRDYSASFPLWPHVPSLAGLLPHLPPAGVALVESLLQYDPSRRQSAREALTHEYFLPLLADEAMEDVTPGRDDAVLGGRARDSARDGARDGASPPSAASSEGSSEGGLARR